MLYQCFITKLYVFFVYLTDELKLTNNWDDFPNQSMGLTEIDGMNEKDEMELTDNCMDVLGFEPEEKQNIYQVVAAVMHLGTMKFKQRGREEQAEADGTKVIFQILWHVFNIWWEKTLESTFQILILYFLGRWQCGQIAQHWFQRFIPEFTQAQNQGWKRICDPRSNQRPSLLLCRRPL